MNKYDEILFNIASGKKDYSDLQVDQCSEQIKFSRIIDPILSSNSEYKIDEMTWNELEQYRIDRYIELYNIVEALNKASINYIVIKGLALLEYYPESLPRQSGDFDFLVKNVNEFWKSHEILSDKGFSISYNPILTEVNGEINGIIKYMKKLNGGKSVFLEVNINSFTISETTCFNDLDLWSERKLMKSNDVLIPIPSHEMNIILLVIEVSGRKQFFIRDAVDFHYLVTDRDVNWSYIEKKLHNKFLINVLKKLQINNETISQTGFIFVEKGVRGLKRELTYIIPNLIQELNFKKFIFRYIKVLGEKLIEKGKISQASQLEYLMDPYERFCNGIATHFYQISFTIKSPDTRWIKYRKFHILLCPIGAFLASNFAILEDLEEKEIKDYITSLEG